MNAQKQASVAEFDNMMDGENPLGDRVDAYAVGMYVIELYTTDFMQKDRTDEYKGRISVFKRVQPDEDHHRIYKNVAGHTFDSFKTAKSRITRMANDESGVESFVENHPV
jgi:hypothetical protein